MPESHTGHNLAEHLRKAVAEWGITEKDPVIVTDNASNMTIEAEGAAFTLHVKCYAPTLNLAAQRALKITAVACLLGRVRHIVSFFRWSTTANHMLKEKQRLLRLPEHKLMTDVVTRLVCGYFSIVYYLFFLLLINLLITLVFNLFSLLCKASMLSINKINKI